MSKEKFVRLDELKEALNMHRDCQDCNRLIDTLQTKEIETADGFKKVAGNGLTHHYVCSECGADLDPDDIYCRKCGVNVEKTED